jgi:hypothetical protein
MGSHFVLHYIILILYISYHHVHNKLCFRRYCTYTLSMVCVLPALYLNVRKISLAHILFTIAWYFRTPVINNIVPFLSFLIQDISALCEGKGSSLRAGSFTLGERALIIH